MADENEKTSVLPSDTLRIRLKAADQQPATLIVLIGPSEFVGKQWSLPDGEYIVGRAPECHIYIDDRSISKSHIKIIVGENETSLYDLKSTNGTIVNSKNLKTEEVYILKDKDQIKLGNVILKFMSKGSLEALAHQELTDRAVKDALTGIYNKLALINKGAEAFRRAETLNEELCILVFDIDFFKKINDGHGHPAGDAVLKQLATIVSTRLVRQQDFFARYGGEEFVILLINTPLTKALEVAERVRSTIETSIFTSENLTISVTVSIGVAPRKPTETTWEETFKRADEALYLAKKNGRNRVQSA